MSQFEHTDSVACGFAGVFGHHFHVSIRLLSFSPVLSTDFLDGNET